jgi:hypothetical protein
MGNRMPSGLSTFYFSKEGDAKAYGNYLLTNLINSDNILYVTKN